MPEELHGAISTGPAGNRVYFGYGTNKNGVLQIVDREQAADRPGRADRREPALSAGRPARAVAEDRRAHDVPDARTHELPNSRTTRDAKRDFVLIVDESLVNECAEARQMVWIADVTVESKPQIVSTCTVPEASGNFCARGGRFGTHSSNENMTPIYYNRVVFLAHFNAGVRAVDIRDPFNPDEIGYYIPAITDKTTRCVKVRRQGALQGGDPDQQRRSRRSRLHLHRRPRQHRPAHPRTDRRRAERREFSAVSDSRIAVRARHARRPR